MFKSGEPTESSASHLENNMSPYLPSLTVHILRPSVFFVTEASEAKLVEVSVRIVDCCRRSRDPSQTSPQIDGARVHARRIYCQDRLLK